MCNDEKKTEKLGVHMGPQLALELMRLAEAEQLPVSTYVHRVLLRHVFGHRAATLHSGEGPLRPDSDR